MNINFEADFSVGILAGATSEGKIKKKFIKLNEKSMCHAFTIKYQCDEESVKVELIPGKLLVNKWLFGPASMLNSKAVIYPCSRFWCSVPCPCQTCCEQPPVSSCQVPANQSCGCKDCMKKLSEHFKFHKALHTKCKFCLHLIEKIPNFNFWFLSSGKRGVLYNRNSREHFLIKNLVVNCKPPAWLLNTNCATYYVKPEGYEKRKQELEASGWVTCDECNYSVRCTQQLKEHIQLNHLVSIRFFHCYFSGSEENKMVYMNCSQCENTYESKKELKRHILKVHYEKTFDCDFCAEVFTREENLERHKNHVHYPQEEKFSCSDCGKKFQRKDNFDRHQSLLHLSSESEKIACDLCASKFSLKANLDRHNRLSLNKDGSHRFQCSDCDEKFCTGKILKEHHNREHVTLSCEDCGLSFAAKSSLDLHMKSKKNLPCDKCDAILCNFKSLNHHKEEVHNTNKCDLCNNSYLPEQLKYHKLMKHEHKK